MPGSLHRTGSPPVAFETALYETARWVAADDPVWDDWIETVPHDIFHTAGYHRYARGLGEGEPFAVVVGDRDRGLMWPYLLRSLPDGTADRTASGASATMDVTSVYGYPGPLAWGVESGDPFLLEAWREVQACWLRQGAVTAFTRFHPLLGNAAIAHGFSAAGADNGSTDSVMDVGRTVSVDLTLGYDGARARYSRDLRRTIDRARERGLVSEHDEDWSELGTFARLYDDTMSRLQAADYYRFQEEDFRRLRDELPDSLHLLVTRSGDRVVAAGLFTEQDGLVEWYLVGTDPDYLARSPSKVLVDFAIEWAGARGGTALHLGGGLGGGEDSLLDFKTRFSPLRHAFWTGRWVLDPTVYGELVTARQSQLEPGTILDPGYFPAYRAPVIAADAL